MRTIVVAGACLAGLSTARALRAQGFDGELIVVGAETHRPYDRPPLSKDFLAGTLSVADLGLESDKEDLQLQWRLGIAATALTPRLRELELSDGSSLVVDGVVLATGAVPRRLPGPSLAGVHVLRSLDDALGLRAELTPGVRLVVIGAGFVGAEVASTARRLGAQVTVIEAAVQPLVGALGPEMAAVVSGLHAANGVELITGVTGRLIGAGRVTGVELSKGRVLPADVVLVGVGVRPAVDWLAGSGVDLSHGVICNAAGATTVPNVVAVGDCSTWYDPVAARHRRVEHWTAARERGAAAATTLLAGDPATLPLRRPAYFWSDQYDTRIQFAGQLQGGETVRVTDGTMESGQCVAVYQRDAEVVAVLGLGMPKAFIGWRKQLVAAAARERA